MTDSTTSGPQAVAAAFDAAQRAHRQGRWQDALTAYDRVLAAMPAHAPALYGSGLILHQAGHHADAARRLQRAVEADPAPPEVWANLGLIYAALRLNDDAVAALTEAARRAPRDAGIAANLAAALLDAGRPAEAEAAARRATVADPRHGSGWFNLALACRAQSRLPEARAAARRAAELAPEAVRPAGLNAELEDASGRPADARATLEAALRRHPDAVALRFQLAGVLERLGELAAAAEALEGVRRLAPEHGAALSQLLFLRRRLADWHDLPALRRAFRRGVDAGRPLLSPFVLLSDPSTRAQQRRCAEAWTAALAPPRPGPSRTLRSAGRLAIGYLSADFHTHATAFLTAGVFERHDRRAFEVIAYSTGPDDGSPMRARLAAAFDRFVDARGWSPEQLATAIRADGIDVLVDLKGHTEAALTPVLAQRPAPIQVQWLGYPGTMGAPYIDYLIGDAVVTPFEEAADYTETIVQLPVCYQPNDRQRPIALPEDRAALGLPPDAVVFCSFNHSFKFNPEVVDAMAQILSRTPGSVLWLQDRGGDRAIPNLRREFVARGIAAERVVAAGWRPNDRYLALYHHADLVLDTWPYGAHTTASDALWAGCPVLTWPGETFASRVAASLVRAVGLPELVAGSAADYVERAVHLAHDGAGRARLRAHLAGPGRASPLFDTDAFVRALERAYLTMAEQFRAGRREPFRVAGGTSEAVAPTSVGE